MRPSMIWFSLAVTAGTAAAQPPPDWQAQLDAWNQGESGGISAVWFDAGGAVFAQSGRYGAGDARPLTPDTKFQIGSITKIFTALLLAETERAGRVTRDDPAAKYLLPAGDPDQVKLAPFTLLRLTTHTAGLPTIPRDFDGFDRKNYTYAQLLAAFRREGATAKPGARVSYSNFGVQLLGHSLAAAWGTSYPAALQTHVLTPLGLKGTSLALAGQPLPADLAPGQHGGKAVLPWTFDAMAPSGALISSARELAGFLAFCLGRTESPLQAALAETMKPQRPVPAPIGGQIGFGWFITPNPEKSIYWHNGGTAGYHAFLAFCPASGQGVALLTNSEKACDPVGFALLGRKPAEPTPTLATGEYAGTYPLAASFGLTVTEENGAVFVQATNQGRNRFTAAGRDEFEFAPSGARLSFLRNGSGRVAALVLRQDRLPDRVALRQP